MFITAVGAEDTITYRYHDLFREFLLGVLSTRKRELFDKAGSYYLKCGAFEQAVEYFRLADNDFMFVQSVEQAGQQMLQHGRLKTVETWLSILTERGLLKSPILLMLKGELLSYSGSFADAESLINQAFDLFKEDGNKEGLARAAIHKARILRYRVSFIESTNFINQFINDVGELPPGYRLEMAAEKVYSQWLTGDILGAIATAELALHDKGGGENMKAAERLFRYMVVLYSIRGMYSSALELYERVLDSCGGEEALEQGSIPLYAAVALRERNDIERALYTLKESVARKQRVNFTEDLHLIYFNIAVTLLNYGDAKEVDHYCQLAEEAFMKTGGHLTYYEVMLKAFRSAFAAYFGGEASPEAESLMEQATNSLKNESAYLFAYISPYFVIYYLRFKQYKRARELLELALPVSEAIGIKFHISILNGLMAAVSDVCGDSERAYESANRSLKLAADEGYERFFVIFPELLSCIKIAVINGLEQEFVEKLILRLDSGVALFLIELLNHKDSKVRNRVAKLLKTGHYSELQKELGLFFFNSDEAVREAGFALLQDIADKGSEIRTKLFVRCMGSFKVYLFDDWKSPILWRTIKAKELFAYLLHLQGQPVSTERILADLWPDLNVEKARNLLHTNLTYVKSLLKRCGLKENFKRDQNGYALDTSGISCDVWLTDVINYPGIYLEDIYSDWPYDRRMELENKW